MSTVNNKILKVLKSDVFWAAFVFLIFTTFLNFFFSALIQYYYPNRQPIIDTLFNLTSYVGWTQYLTDLAVLVSPPLLLYFVIKKDLIYLPYYIFSFSIAYFLRGLMIFLNPIGGANGNMEQYGLTSIMQHGIFPSGHTILVFVAYFVSREICSVWVRSVLLLMCIIEVVSLVLSRGHYAIDIIGGILVAYFVVNELARRKEKFKL